MVFGYTAANDYGLYFGPGQSGIDQPLDAMTGLFLGFFARLWNHEQNVHGMLGMFLITSCVMGPARLESDSRSKQKSMGVFLML
jgi:hypothetical protein